MATATTKVTLHDLSRVIQNKLARARIKTLLDAITDAMDAGALVALSVTTAMLKDLAVTAAKIANNTITPTQLATIVMGAPTTRGGPGPIAVTAPTCLLSTTGTGDALTIASGTYAGQRLTIKCVSDGGTGVITQASGAALRAAVTSITFTNVGDWVVLEWSGSLWNDVAHAGVTIAVS